MVEKRYGIIADLHKHPAIVGLAVDALIKEGIDTLILNGDLGNDAVIQVAGGQAKVSGYDFIDAVLEIVAQKGLETFVSAGGVDKIHVQPGSHESVAAFHEVIKEKSKKYSNIISVFDVPKVEEDSHHLVFLPGSDWVSGGQYHVFPESSGLKSGVYLNDGSNYHKIEDDNLMSQIAADPRYRDSLMWVTNMEDVRDLVTQPDKTILVSHIPPKFDNVDNCVDFAHFCKINDGGIAPIFAADYFRAQGATVVEKKENRGNADLRKLIDDVGITKGVHNHFHESGHRANNLRSDSVKQGEFVDDLFYNSGSPDQGQCGIYSVRSDGKVAYKNISLS